MCGSRTWQHIQQSTSMGEFLMDSPSLPVLTYFDLRENNNKVLILEEKVTTERGQIH